MLFISPIAPASAPRCSRSTTLQDSPSTSATRGTIKSHQLRLLAARTAVGRAAWRRDEAPLLCGYASHTSTREEEECRTREREREREKTESKKRGSWRHAKSRSLSLYLSMRLSLSHRSPTMEKRERHSRFFSSMQNNVYGSGMAGNLHLTREAAVSARGGTG